MFFYPKDFTPVCSTEVPKLNEMLDKFKQLNAEVLGISVQDVQSHKKWAKELGGLDHPLLSDVDKKVSKQYGVLRPDGSVSLRGTFIIDPQGTMQFVNIHNMNVGRSVEELVRVLEALKSGGLCPVDWKKDMKPLSPHS